MSKLDLPERHIEEIVKAADDVYNAIYAAKDVSVDLTAHEIVERTLDIAVKGTQRLVSDITHTASNMLGIDIDGGQYGAEEARSVKCILGHKVMHRLVLSILGTTIDSVQEDKYDADYIEKAAKSSITAAAVDGLATIAEFGGLITNEYYDSVIKAVAAEGAHAACKRLMDGLSVGKNRIEALPSVKCPVCGCTKFEYTEKSTKRVSVAYKLDSKALANSGEHSEDKLFTCTMCKTSFKDADIIILAASKKGCLTDSPDSVQ